MSDRSETLRYFAERIVKRSASPETGIQTIDDCMAAARAKYVDDPRLVARVISQSRLPSLEANDSSMDDRLDRLGEVSENLIGEGSRQAATSKILHLSMEVVKEPWLLGEDYGDKEAKENVCNIEIDASIESNDKLFASVMAGVNSIQQGGQPISGEAIDVIQPRSRNFSSLIVMEDVGEWVSVSEESAESVADRLKQDKEHGKTNPGSSRPPLKPARE